MKKNRAILPVLLLSFLFARSAVAATYAVDLDHTSVSFKIRHILSYVQGHFREFEGTVSYEPGKPETWSAEGVIQAASIDTNVPPRDKHLRSADFFDVEQYPTISFTTTKVLEAFDTAAKLEGLLTLHGVEKPVVLDVEIHGVAKDPWGNTRASFTVTTLLNRKDFGLTWNKTLETGQVLVGEEVKITLEVEGILQE